MDTSWIVTGNAGRVRIFGQAHARSPLTEIADRVNEAVRLRAADTESDGLGRRGSSTGLPGSGTPSQNSGYQPHQTPVQHQSELFARDVATYLAAAHREQRFKSLTLLLAPEFLGVLRAVIDPHLAKVVSLEIGKDWSHSSGVELLRHLEKHREKA